MDFFNFAVFVSMSFQYLLWQRNLNYSQEQVIFFFKETGPWNNGSLFFCCWKSCLKLNVGLNEDVERFSSIYIYICIYGSLNHSCKYESPGIDFVHVDLNIFASQGFTMYNPP